MLLETYKANELMWLINVNAPLGSDKEAFRGDLVIELGDMHEASQTRNPPKKVFEQVALLAEGGKITFLSGYISDLAHIADLTARYGSDFADGMTGILFCLNIKDPLQVEHEGVTWAVFPMDEGLVWNELMDLLYVEKSDLKGQEPEEKIETVAAAKGELSPKGDVMPLADALGKTVAIERSGRGPV